MGRVRSRRLQGSNGPSPSNATESEILDGTLSGTLTDLTTVNLNTGLTNTSQATAKAGAGAGIDLTGGSTIDVHFFASRDVHHNVWFGGVIIAPGHTYGIKFVFDAAGTAAATILWSETTA